MLGPYKKDPGPIFPSTAWASLDLTTLPYNKGLLQPQVSLLYTPQEKFGESIRVGVLKLKSCGWVCDLAALNQHRFEYTLLTIALSFINQATTFSQYCWVLLTKLHHSHDTDECSNRATPFWRYCWISSWYILHTSALEKVTDYS